MILPVYHITYKVRKRSRYYLYLVVRWSGKTSETATGMEINPDRWTGRRAAPRSTHGEDRMPASVINQRLDAIEQAVADYWVLCGQTNTLPTPESLRHHMEARMDKGHSIEITFQAFVRDRSRMRRWADNTIKSVMRVGEIIAHAAPGMRTTDLTADNIERIRAWMETHKLSSCKKIINGEGYRHATIEKTLAILRWYIKWLISEGYLPPTAMPRLPSRGRHPKRVVTYLTPDEIQRIRALDLRDSPALEVDRDYLLLMCATSLRYSDVAALTTDKIGTDYIEVTLVKTGVPVRIELNDLSREILRRRIGEAEGKRVMPKKAVGTINYGIKRLGQMAGINDIVTYEVIKGGKRYTMQSPKWEMLSTHVGRRTFIVTALSSGIPEQIVRKWTGHTSYEALRPYLDIIQTATSKAMPTIGDALLGKAGL